jgi:hypothetical protein
MTSETAHDGFHHGGSRPGIESISHDLRFFCYQAAMARPGPVTGIALDNWFFGERSPAGCIWSYAACCFQ